MRIERRLQQPRWLNGRRPDRLARSSRSSSIGDRAAGDRPRRRSHTFRRLFDAGVRRAAARSTQTLIAATPLAFTGLGAAAAFRMRLFNIGGEGQLYIGAIAGAAAGLCLGGHAGVAGRDRGDGRRRRCRRRRAGR